MKGQGSGGSRKAGTIIPAIRSTTVLDSEDSRTSLSPSILLSA